MSQELIFDRSLLIKRRSNKAGSIHKADFLIKRSLKTIIERLESMTIEFPTVLNLGSRSSYGTDYFKNRVGTNHVIETDISFDFMQNSSHSNKLVCDEEYLPFADNQFDLIVTILNLHMVNDLPGCLVQLRRMLKPNGVLIASIFGESSLASIREILINTELELFGGASARIFPFAEIKQVGMLLQRAGFSMPVIDKDIVNVKYSNPLSLLHDLQNMAESNILLARNKDYVGKSFWQNFSKIGEILVSFEILNILASKD
jgi:NADH dehydrogenase [ubiquinone] 1 alpha subcomplex assembly factor 5